MAEAEEAVPAFHEAFRHVKVMKGILVASGLLWIGLGVGYLVGAVEFHLPKEPAQHPAMFTPANTIPFPLRPLALAKARKPDCEAGAIMCSVWETDHPGKALQALASTFEPTPKKRYSVNVEINEVADPDLEAPPVPDGSLPGATVPAPGRN